MNDDDDDGCDDDGGVDGDNLVTVLPLDAIQMLEMPNPYEELNGRLKKGVSFTEMFARCAKELASFNYVSSKDASVLSNPDLIRYLPPMLWFVF